MDRTRLSSALEYALFVHGDQVRKGTSIPYISHLLQVAGLVLEFGGNEHEAIGGLLHDCAEDGGGESVLAAIRDQFGEMAERIVRENSDSITESKDVKAPWRERKEKYIAGIATKSASALLVSICDKIHNARSLNADSWFLGEAYWDRFNASKVDSIWYYQSLIKAFQLRESDDSRLTSALASLKLEVESFTSK